MKAMRDEELTIHGRRVCFRAGGSGPPIVLVHGITGRSEQWDSVVPLLSDRFQVLAPDLLGHGRSAKPAGDYSLGAYASGIRDLMIALGIERATVVGHSLGGGIAMQFAYQFPERCERLALVSSGGLGKEVNLLLRAATLPGSELVLPLIAHDRVLAAGSAVGGLLERLGLRAGSDLAEMSRGYSSLVDSGARQAFLLTLRGLLDASGQRVSAVDRLYLASEMPTLIVWGRRDPMIPVHHAGIAHRAMPSSRLEVFDRAGHFPQLEEPVRFASVLGDFIDSTEPSQIDPEALRKRVLEGPDDGAAPDGGAERASGGRRARN